MDDVVKTVEDTWVTVCPCVHLGLQPTLTFHSGGRPASRIHVSPPVFFTRLPIMDLTFIIRFKGSDDDLRSRFEEYICAALSSIKYADFIVKGRQQDIAIVGVGAYRQLRYCPRMPAHEPP